MYHYITDTDFVQKLRDGNGILKVEEHYIKEEVEEHYIKEEVQPHIQKWKFKCLLNKSLRPLFLMNSKPSSLYDIALFLGSNSIPDMTRITERPREAYIFLKLYADIDASISCLRLPDHDNHPKTNIAANEHFFVHMSWILYCMQHKSAINILTAEIDLWPYETKLIHDKIKQICGLLSNKAIIIYRFICNNYDIFNIFVGNFIMSALKYCKRYQQIHGNALLIGKPLCSDPTISLFTALSDFFGTRIVPWLMLKNYSKQNGNRLHNLHKKCWKEFIEMQLPANLNNFLGKLIFFEECYSNRIYGGSKTKKDIKCGNYLCQRPNVNLNFKICSGCNVVFYCGIKCQKYDWNVFNHKLQCNMVQDFILQTALDEFTSEII
eukprot:507306_1